MTKHKYIDCDIYKRGINVFIGTPDELKEWCRNHFGDDDDMEFNIGLNNCKYGVVDFHYGNGYAVIRIPRFPHAPEEFAYTSHEIFHAACWLLWYSGVEFNNDDFANETYSYLIEYITRCVLQQDGYEDV